MPTAIRQLAASRTGRVLAAGEFESRVHLFDLQTSEALSSFDTTLDFGGRRLAISEDGGTVLVGAYYEHGIAAYSADTGEELWRRKDLKKVQHVRFHANEHAVFCGLEVGGCRSLDVGSGKERERLRGVSGAWESPFGPTRLLERRGGYTIESSTRRPVAVPAVGFAVLAVAFSPDLVCVSEASGPVRAFDVGTGVEVWQHAPPVGSHFLRIAYLETEGAFAGVSWAFVFGGTPLLQRFSAEGRAETVGETGPGTELEFCLRGGHLITNEGVLVEVSTGTATGVLPFPAQKGG